MKKGMLFGLIFLSVLIFLMIISTGCKKQEAERPGLTDTLMIPSGCSSDNQSTDNCCYNLCLSHCTENNYPYTKHYTNIIHCGCWCG